MKQGLISSSGKIELKSKLRSVSITQMRDLKINKFLGTELLTHTEKTNQCTPKTHRRLSKESISPGYRKIVKTVIHKSSPMNFEIVPSGKLETLDKKHFIHSKELSLTVRKNYLKAEKSPAADNMKNTISRSHFLNKFKSDMEMPCQVLGETCNNAVLDRIKEKFLLFKRNHYSILKDFNV